MTDAAHDAGDEEFVATAPERPITPGQALWYGFRQPLVAVLLLIALSTAISGKPLDGVLMLTVATLVAWDAARSRLRAPAGPAEYVSGTDRTSTPGRAPARRRRTATGLTAIAAASLYAGLVGSFSRFSWPATSAVVVVGCLVVAIGWQGPLRQRPALAAAARRRSWLWGAIVVVGSSLELSSLLQQPHLTTDSYAHPTISALTDPLLAGHAGRSALLASWLLTGWYLVTR